MARQPDLQRVYRDHLEQLRRWGVLATLRQYKRIDLADLDGSLERIAPALQALYAASVINALDATDEYMGLVAWLHGQEYVADWRKGRPEAPQELFGGVPFAQWMAYAAPGIKRLIAEGVPAAEAVGISEARTAQRLTSSPMQQARSTTWNRFLTDSLISESNVPPVDLKPWTDEVEQYANLWDGQRVREYPGTFQRWQRVPSPGACGWCLMLATRSDYTSADAAMYAGGAEGTVRRQFRRGREGMLAGVSRRSTSAMESGERYHRSCRCTVRMVAMGSPAAISPEDYERLSTRDEDGNLPVFYSATRTNKSGRVSRYEYTLDSFDFEVTTGTPLPPTAPWKDAWKAPPKYRTDRGAYSQWRNEVPV